jgi:hypothetical protein
VHHNLGRGAERLGPGSRKRPPGEVMRYHVLSAIEAHSAKTINAPKVYGKTPSKIAILSSNKTEGFGAPALRMQKDSLFQ